MSTPTPDPMPRWYPSDATVHHVETFSGLWKAYLQGRSVQILLVQLAIALAVRPWVGPFQGSDVLILAAIALYWPLQEWFAHVWLLHARPRTFSLPGGRVWRFDPLAARAHRYHHEHPWKLHPIFVPWPVIAALVPLHLLAWWWLAPTPALMVTGVAAFTGATLLYEWLHLLAHVRWVPANAYLRRVQQHHRAHHFRNEQHWFAFSVPPLDDWMGTGGAPRDVPQSDTTHNLGITG